MDTLPNELLNHICTYLPRLQLTRLALTSPSLLAAARWHLYTSVVLCSNSRSIGDTIDLIENNPDLARRTQSLSIETDPQWYSLNAWRPAGYTWIKSSFFSKALSLRSLRFHLLPCVVGDPDEATEFRTILDNALEQCPLLAELIIFGFCWPRLPEDWVMPPIKRRDPVFETRLKLRKVVYHSFPSSGFNWTFVVNTFCSPSSNITYLDLSIGKWASHFSSLRMLSFPALRTLYLRTMTPAWSNHLAVFLVSHPSIHHLFLIDVDPPISLDKMVITSLPALKTLQGNPQLLSRLASCCESIRHIRTLILDYTGVHDFHYVDSTDHLVQAVGGFPNLRRCSITKVISAPKTADIARLLVDSVQLTYWSGGFYYRDVGELKNLADAFSTFPALSRLDICEWTNPNPPMPEQINGLYYVVRQNLQLQMICLYMTHLETNEISTVYRVQDRSKEGAWLKETYRCVEGGPYYQERRYVDYPAMDWEAELLLEER